MLTDTRIRTAKPRQKPYKLTDSNGLHLEVRPSGKKLWRFRYRIAGKENLFALGEYGTSAGQLSLSDARRERDNARHLVKQGLHPAHSRRAAKAAKVYENRSSFEAVAREWIEQNRARWSPYYLSQVERALVADVFPYVGNLPIRTVSAAHLLEIVKRVEKRAPSVALLVRQWCSGVFRFAVATLRADGDPSAALRGAISRPRVEHRQPLTTAEIPKLLKKLDENGGFRTTTIAMRLLLLTFVRPVELRAAEWTEFDLDNSTWRIPAGRMKARQVHIVPLAPQAVELLRELRTITGGSNLLFPNNRRPRTCMTATTMNRALERMGYGGKFSAHGFRATASTILNEQGYRADVIERQLAHAPRDKVRASYNRAEHLAERKQMMRDWANYIDALAAGVAVVPIRKGVA
ncbi:MAG: tyrosine-type recombinase/integrase [Acidobacteriaceae bacterium]